MPCADCIQQAQQRNEAENTILEKAAAMAKLTGQWIGIYTDEFGVDQFVTADQFSLYPNIRRYITPKHVFDSSIQ